MRQDLLVPTAHTSHCPYKGDARYWSIRVGDCVAENAVWNYPTPIEGCPPIANLNEKVDLVVDGERQERPSTPWS